MKNNYTRRNFIRKSTVAVAGVFTAPYILNSCKSSDRVKLAFIGMGGRGQGLLKQFILTSGTEVVAICDPFKERREDRCDWVKGVYTKRNEKAEIKYDTDCVAYNRYDEMLEKEDIDAVVIATPDHWHVPMAYAAVSAGKDVYVEKPLSLTIEQGQKIRTLVHSKNAIFQYGTQQRSDRAFRLAAELAANKAIGDLVKIDVWCSGGIESGKGIISTPMPVPDGFDYDLWQGPAELRPYTKDRVTNYGSWFIYDYAIGFIAGWGAHPLDIAQWGNKSDHTSPVYYEGTGSFFEPKNHLFNTITNWDIKCKYANGVIMHFFSNDKVQDYVDSEWNFITGHGTTFWGTDGWVNVDRNKIVASDPRLLNIQYGEGEQLYVSENHYQNFIDCVRSRKQPVSTIDAAVRSDTISHLGDILIRSEAGNLEWDPEKEEIINPTKEMIDMLHRPQRKPYNIIG